MRSGASDPARPLREREPLREALPLVVGRRLRRLAERLHGRRAGRDVAHAATSPRPPPVIAIPSSSSVAVGGNSPTISPS